jgi:ribosomal protein L7/L12
MTELTPSGAEPARGLKGWFQRRTEVLLRKPGRALPALSEPGDSQVVLQVTGPTPIQVVKVICQATGLDLISASHVAGDAPVVVVSGISEASAEAVVERLKKAGARAVAGGSYTSP